MIPKEILQKVRRIQITSSRMVTDIFAGQYHSVFKGRGIEFDQIAQYQPGDDIRTIDWKRTARTGNPFVKRYVEERELTVMLLVDASASLEFGSVQKLKKEWVAELSALLAFSAITNNDKVGLIVFTDEIELFVPPKKGKRHVLRVIRELLYFEPKKKGTDLGVALRYLDQVTTRRTVSFLISDFQTEGFEKDLRMANKRHDVVALAVTDPKEMKIPSVGILELQDSETGETVLVDTGSALFQKQYPILQGKRWHQLKKQFQSMNVDHVLIETGESYITPLVQFFRMREKRH